jgi:hypothetical protein
MDYSSAITFNSGLKLSVCAGANRYSLPKGSQDSYTHIEVYGRHPLLRPSSDGISVYVPALTIVKIVEQEGGILDGEFPPLSLKYDIHEA